MNRTEIIRSLNVEYQKGLPDIPKDSSGYLQESTNTLMCFGNCVAKQPSEIRRAQMYFSQVQIELKKRSLSARRSRKNRVLQNCRKRNN